MKRWRCGTPVCESRWCVTCGDDGGVRRLCENGGVVDRMCGYCGELERQDSNS